MSDQRLTSEERYQKRQAEEKANLLLVRSVLEKVSTATTVDDIITAFREMAKVGLKMLDDVAKENAS